jgi:exopolysaccharide biosynthesis protein
MKTIFLLILLGLAVCRVPAYPSIAYQKIKACGTVGHVVTVNLADPEVRISVALARGGAGKSESFKSMINRTRPAVAITGTFFDTKTMIPTGDIALFGILVHSGCIGSALCIDSSNKATIVPLHVGRENKWNGYETVLCAGPTLVADGKVALAPKHEGFSRVAMYGKRRTAVGITKSGKLILVCVNRNTSLYNLAKFMLQLNTVSAVCLDGGSSTAFYHNGRYLAMPRRTLTNCLVVYKSSNDYLRAKEELAPAKLIAKAESTIKPKPDINALASIISELRTPNSLHPTISEQRQ